MMMIGSLISHKQIKAKKKRSKISLQGNQCKNIVSSLWIYWFFQQLLTNMTKYRLLFHSFNTCDNNGNLKQVENIATLAVCMLNWQSISVASSLLAILASNTELVRTVAIPPLPSPPLLIKCIF